MSHFEVVVIGNNPKKQLELYRDIKWDYYTEIKKNEKVELGIYFPPKAIIIRDQYHEAFPDIYRRFKMKDSEIVKVLFRWRLYCSRIIARYNRMKKTYFDCHK